MINRELSKQSLYLNGTLLPGLGVHGLWLKTISTIHHGRQAWITEFHVIMLTVKA